MAGVPAAFEPPSASFVLDWGSIRAMRARGIVFAAITLAAGISSTGDSELDRRLPFDEAYRIPDPAASAIRQGRAAGGRIIAIGTTVVRALEHAARQGGVRAGEGRTTENRGPRRAWFARWGGNTGEPRDASTRWDYWPGASWIRLARVMTECQPCITDYGSRASLSRYVSSGSGRHRRRRRWSSGTSWSCR
ncbi:MAG: hypothetical protein DMF96_01670 [Acidobacteria bacterium]|nr:MAG: hypothetical protein DMF96_01670 [Acidobacteriota bacterium]